MLYSFSIFDRHCNCIYSRKYGPAGTGEINADNTSDISKLLFGVLYSLKNISGKLGDNNKPSENDVYIGKCNYLKSFSTANFRIHYMETLSNFKFILITDNYIDDLQEVLWVLYSNYFLKNIALNPLSKVEYSEAETINNANFVNQTDKYLQGLAIFDN